MTEASTADISIDEYVRRRQIELGQSLSGRTAVYLDTKFWIVVREVLSGLRTQSAEVEVARLLRSAVAGGTAFCPLSDSLFIEFMKQSDPNSRRSTARLVDEFSLGVTLIPSRRRIATEIAHFIHSFDKNKSLHPIQNLIWSKSSYVLGYVHPTNAELDSETQHAVQKLFFDHMWMVPLSEMVELIGSTSLPSADLDESADQMKRGSAAHAHEIKSFRQAYEAEVRGIIDLCGEVAVDVVAAMWTKISGSLPEIEPRERAVYENQWKNLLLFALANEATKKALATMHIEASLHASVRWDKQRKLTGNDLYDFHHESAAVAYCDAFLTDRPLCALVTQNHLGLTKLFPCRVIANTEDAIEFLKTLN